MSRNMPTDRETLYEEVWAQPLTVVAMRYGVSDVALIKRCKRMSVPVPGRGYWAKVRAGQTPRKAQLPQLRPDGWIPLGPVPLTESELAEREAIYHAIAESKRALDGATADSSSLRAHPLVKATGVRLRQSSGWEHCSGIRSAPQDVLDISVTKGSVTRALELTSALFKLLEPLEFDVRIDTNKAHTMLLGRGTSIPLAITEHVSRSRHTLTKAEERAQKRYFEAYRYGRHLDYPDIPEFDWTPSGRLTISVGRYPLARNWNDTAKTALETRLTTIATEIVGLAEGTRKREEEEQRRETARRAAQDAYELAVAQRNQENEKFSSLVRNASRFRRANALREYINAVSDRASVSGKLDSTLQEWVAWARSKADWIDPLIDVSDPVLDAPEPTKPSYWKY